MEFPNDWISLIPPATAFVSFKLFQCANVGLYEDDREGDSTRQQQSIDNTKKRGLCLWHKENENSSAVIYYRTEAAEIYW